MDKITFNKYGNAHIPEAIREARRKYWETVEPFLSDLSVVELRALSFYLEIEGDLCSYILRRQMNEVKKERVSGKENGR
jgi:hypothetical protein